MGHPVREDDLPASSLRWYVMGLWLALLLQTVFVFFLAHPWLTADAEVYLDLASRLDLTGRFAREGVGGKLNPEMVRPPGYAFFLLLFHRLVGLPLSWIVALQLCLYLASVGLVHRFLVRRGINPAVFLTLAVAYVFTPMYSAFLMTEGLSLLAVTAIALALSTPEPSKVRLVTVGALLGALCLLRSDFILLPFLVVGYVVVRDVRRAEPRTRLLRFATSLIPLAVAGAILLPYAAWNAKTFSKPSPLPVGGAIWNSIYLSTWQGKLPLDDLNALYGGVVTPRAEEAGLGAETRALNAEVGTPPLNAFWAPNAKLSPEIQLRSQVAVRKLAIKRIEADTGHYAWHVVRNIWALWNTSKYPESAPDSGVFLLRALALAATILGLAGAGLSLLRVAGWPLPAFPALVLLYVPAIHVFLHTEARYTATVRLLLLMQAAALIGWLFQRVSRTSVRRRVMA